jgi:predicted small lipoprotein YifL
MKYSFLSPTLLAIVSLFSISACGKSGMKPLALNTKTTPPSRSESLEKGACPVPFGLDNLTRAPIVKLEDLPKAKLKVIEMQMHMFYEADGNSFSALSREADEFEVKVECSDVKTWSEENYERKSTDEDGTEHLSSSSKTQKLQGTFSASTSVDAIGMVRADDVRIMKVEFENGKLALAQSSIEADPGKDRSFLKEIPTGRMELGGDNFLTLRIDRPSATQLEFRMKWEGPKNDEGKRAIQHSRVVYETI